MPKCMRLLLLVLGIASAGRDAAAEDAPRIYQEEFHLHSDGRFQLPGWMEEAPESAQLLAESGCRSLGFNCSDDPDEEDQSIRYMKPMIRSGDYRGTARIVRQRRDSYYAKFTAPKGFTTCKAGIYLKDGSISEGSTFAGAIQRSGLDGLSVYADLGADNARPRAIEFRLLIQFVPKPAAGSRRCWPDQTIVFLCRGPKGCQASRAYPETYLR